MCTAARAHITRCKETSVSNPSDLCAFKYFHLQRYSGLARVMPAISYQVNPEYARLSEVVPGLFICGVSELNRQNMEKNGITMIVNATQEVRHFFSFSRSLIPQNLTLAPHCSIAVERLG